MSASLEHAKALAKRFHVFPLDHPKAGTRCRGIKTKAHDPDTCEERGKHPTCKWSEWSTQDPGLLAKAWYFGGDEPRNIGIDCGKSDLLVIDEDELGEFDRFCKMLGVEVPATLTVRTGKGRHFYFRQPEGAKLRNTEGALRDYRVNVRGVGGYVVGPGSLHASGAIYTMVDPDAAIAPCPEWLARALARRPSSSNTGGSGKGDHWWRHGSIPAGKRHSAVVAMAGWYLHMGHTLDEAMPALRDLFSRLEGGKYSWADVLAKAQDVYERYEAGYRGDERARAVEQPDDESFWTARAELADLRQFARARAVSPWAMFGCVLAFVASRSGPHVVLPPQVGGKASLNILVGLVGSSGSGKDAALAAARACQVFCVRMPLGVRRVDPLPMPSSCSGTHRGVSRYALAAGPVEWFV